MVNGFESVKKKPKPNPNLVGRMEASCSSRIERNLQFLSRFMKKQAPFYYF